MRKQHIFRPNGRNNLEVRITPSAVGLEPAVEMVRIDADPYHPVRHGKVHYYAHPPAHRVTRPGGGISGGSYTITIIDFNGSGGGVQSGGSGGVQGGGSGVSVAANGEPLGNWLLNLLGGETSIGKAPNNNGTYRGNTGLLAPPP
jgi:hypothetical protein